MPESESVPSTILHPKNFPKDLLIILLWLAVTVLTVYIPGLNESIVRIIFTVPVLLFIPGYVLVAALFPNRFSEKKGIDGIERFALSVGLSIAVVPLIGLLLNYTPFGIRLDPITVSLVIFIVAMTGITLFRRARLPKENQYYVPFDMVFPALREKLFPAGQKNVDKVLSVVLVVVIVAVLVTAVWVAVFPKDGEEFTEFYILGKDKTADNYPASFSLNKNQFVWLGIGNHEHRDVTYTVETLLLKAKWDNEKNDLVITSSKVLKRFEVPVKDAETYLEKYTFKVNKKKFNRIEFLLYDDKNIPDVSATPEEKINAAYRDLHLWITVK